jgi:hypothetical protein
MLLVSQQSPPSATPARGFVLAARLDFATLGSTQFLAEIVIKAERMT